MTVEVAVDAEALRKEVRKKYQEVAANPHASFHFHTGRPLAARLGYESVIVDGLPDAAVESFAGVANPLALRPLVEGERVVDVGSGAGFDCFAGRSEPAFPQACEGKDRVIDHAKTVRLLFLRSDLAVE